MSYQIALILILIVAALIIGKKFNSSKNADKELVYEDEMDEDELKDLDNNIN
tara:strand:+ start:2218 stop:2373 length:156 start_codon:yes stop_codon:yes gene_type:complete